VETSVLDQIKEEGLKRSQVMQTLSYLCDVIGPRLTASPGMRRANEWTRQKLSEWGLEDAHLEAWGPFGRGWTLKRFSMQVVEPQCIPLIAFPKAWSPGTPGAVTGEVVYFEARNEQDLEKYKGKLKGAIVLVGGAPRDVKAHFEPEGTRMTDTQLLNMANGADPAPRPAGPRRSPFGFRPRVQPGGGPSLSFLARRAQFLIEEGAAVLVDPSFRGDGGNIFVAQASAPFTSGRRVPVWDKNPPAMLPQVAMSIEHYNRLVRMVQQGEKLQATIDLAVEFHDDDLMGYNTIAEIPGTDPELKDEIVMLGAHMDSWHGGTGATDNGAGTAVCMEAVRIIQALKLKPKRTIRIALWSGEEQGLYGSEAYVKEHFGSYETGAPFLAKAVMAEIWGGPPPVPKLVTKPEYDKFSAYFNYDNGTGKIRGVYMEGNAAVRPIFRRWLSPLRELGATTLTPSPTGGTDHMSFNAIGLPGFQFIQDPIEYDTRTHHSTQDVYERIQAEDVKQASVVMANFVYQAAQAKEKLPRKPLSP
jgi:hypothetical protein